MANTFKETLRTFRAVNKAHGFRARIVAPEEPQPTANVPIVYGTQTTAVPNAGGFANGNVAAGGYQYVILTATPPAAASPSKEPVRAVLELYDAIGSDFFGDGITAKTISAAMKQAEAAKATVLDIYINSPGGDVFEATAIFNILDRFAGKKNVYVDGLAASAASYIAMVGNTITTAPNAMWMVHDPWGFAVGNSADMREAADLLDKVGGTLVGTYVSKNRKNVSDNEMRSIMANETWMTAEEALAKGFTDAIGSAADDTDNDQQDEPDQDPDDAKLAASARATAILSKFKKVPEQLRPDTRARIASMEARTSPRSKK